MKAVIFNYRVWDGQSGAHIIPTRRATREFIRRIKGEPIEESAATVDENCVSDGQEILEKTKGQ